MSNATRPTSNQEAKLHCTLLKSRSPSYQKRTFKIMIAKLPMPGGAVAEWSKALLLREKINENPKKIPGSPPGLGNLLKKNFRQ